MPPESRGPAPTVRDDTADLKLLFSELVRLETELWGAVEARLLADYRLALPKFEFLQVISRVPGCRVHDIAGAMAITVGGTSKIVDRLEADGLCARRANPADRRSSIIELTAAGERMLVAATIGFEDELHRRLGSVLPDRARAQFIQDLGRLRAAVRSAG